MVLPLPDGPTSATSSPGSASKSMSSRANGGDELELRDVRHVADRLDVVDGLDQPLDGLLVDRGGGDGSRPCRRRRVATRRRRSRPRSWARADGTASVGYRNETSWKRTLPRTCRRVERDRVGRVDDLGVHLEVLEDPVEEGERALDLDLDVEQLAEREEQPALERRERDDRAGDRARPGCRSRPACRRASTRTPA